MGLGSRVTRGIRIKDVYYNNMTLLCVCELQKRGGVGLSSKWKSFTKKARIERRNKMLARTRNVGSGIPVF